MNKTTKKIREAHEFVASLEEDNQVNGNFTNDSLAELYTEAKKLEKTSKGFRKDFLKAKIKKRAKESGQKNDQDHALMCGERFVAEVSGRARSSVDFEGLKNFFIEKTQDKEVVEMIFNLMKKSGFSKTSVREAIEEGEVPSEFLSKPELSYEDHVEGNYVSVTEKEGE